MDISLTKTHSFEEITIQKGLRRELGGGTQLRSDQVTWFQVLPELESTYVILILYPNVSIETQLLLLGSDIPSQNSR